MDTNSVPKNNLAGKIFGRLTVIKFDHRSLNGSRSRPYYLCKCECGNEKIVASDALLHGNTISCGCAFLEHISRLGKSTRTDGKIMSAKTMWKNSYSDGCTFDTFMKFSQEPCFYCGTLLSNTFNIYINKNGQIKKGVSEEWANQSWFRYNGLDRLDSNLPHNVDNIVPCCSICNYAKSTMSLEEFREWIKRVHTHLIETKW